MMITAVHILTITFVASRFTCEDDGWKNAVVDGSAAIVALAAWIVNTHLFLNAETIESRIPGMEVNIYTSAIVFAAMVLLYIVLIYIFSVLRNRV